VSSTNNEDKVSMPPNDCIMLIHNVIFFLLLLGNSESFLC
jgi:hypothetical protein